MKKYNPLVSVIVPFHNNEKFIGECVKSIINQTYSKLEIILIDNLSSDNSYKICCDFQNKDSRIKIFKENKIGVSNARNLGLKKSHGKYICFVDGDDYLDKDFVLILFKLIRKKMCQISGCSFDRIKNGIIKKGELIKNKVFLNDEFYDINAFSCSVCNKLFSRDVIDVIEFNSKYVLGEDYLFLSQVLMNATIKRLATTDKVLYFYRDNISSATHKALNFDRMFSNLKTREYLAKKIVYFSKKRLIVKEIYHNYLICYYSIFKRLKSFIPNIFFSIMLNYYHVSFRCLKYLSFKDKLKIILNPFVLIYKIFI